MAKKFMSMDGNTAAAYSSYALTEVAGIYPITPSSPMAEVTDTWSTQGRENVFGQQVKVSELQSEAGAAGAVHGALQGGTLATTYTASQGLLLMIPNIYKMSGELLPGVIHVAARALASRALNIFGDHEDIYACRQTGACMIASHSVQEAMDLGGVAHLAAIKGSVPFIHFFDGFRTSHEIQKIETMDYDFLKSQLDMEALEKFRANALNPHTNPVTRGGAENDDIFFQGREAQNEHYAKVPDMVNDYMEAVSKHTGRNYAPFTYYGDADAERIIIAMGSVTETIQETIDAMCAAGEKVGLIKVHLYRPFSAKYLLRVLPSTVKKIAVLDRTKEMGAREPLYLDVLSVLKDKDIEIIGGRYGLGSKDTTAGQIKAVYDELKKDAPKPEFTIGIEDDVTNLSLSEDKDFKVTSDYTSCLFWGLGSDGTVSANKNAIKIIGDNTDLYAQAYFAYDSKKAGGVTRSHLRFGKSPIRSTYYINNADFISCSLDAYMFKYDLLKSLKDGGTFLLNTTFSKDEIVKQMPNRIKARLAKSNAKFYIIDATDIASKIGMGRRTNTILQSAFFALNEQIMPYDKAVDLMKEAAKKSYGKKGDDVVEMNYKAIDEGKAGLVEVNVDPAWADLKYDELGKTTGDEYFDKHVEPINMQMGNDLPVSAFTKYNLLDGSMRNNVAFKEKREIATEVPTWHPENCIQCGFCSFVCPHATVRQFMLTDEEIEKAPQEFETIQAMGKGCEDFKYRIQVSPDNCVGCGLCVVECPGKAGNKALEMVEIHEMIDEAPLADYLYKETEPKLGYHTANVVKESQFMTPYFEVSGACPGCGETPYYRLASQLFGKDMMVANATGCSSIYCGSTPSTPFITDKNGEGVAWANSLFEDNAEYGYGMALAQTFKEATLLDIMERNMDSVEPELKDVFQKYIDANGNRDAQRAVKDDIISLVKASKNDDVKKLLDYERDLVGKSVWIVGGDGWAYDIGYGGLDHVLANDLNVNILVLDTEVYSNTGGQSSKASQAASIAKFAAGGKATSKKDLGQIAMAYGHVYVASISMGANRIQTLKAFKEAESYDGPSLIIAYAPCIEHGIKGGLSNHQKTQKAAVECGYWTLYRYDPRNEEKPLTIDSKAPDFDKFQDFILNETRYSQLVKIKGETAYNSFAKTKADAEKRYNRLSKLAEVE
ncbi:pyruvate-ferredoxin/flavodoxin oxidoreductase [Breznakia sp. PF5-3]|uniref:pyruvate:ferredoxin (flavodoxin) oxidoreductase n=1 Tax=unclassified Breznakia TaxID=2623764 RepID=UPI0024074E96|nr:MULTISPECIES: pyruvate:ferredoxin (flavodoxin) oxidoreductase [unclassified Breznakia]MDF9824299.1 pyruvate-ferredoxin/flavodoxin oxidoreductase [Breznakia sp. PM6-1]MDF9835523.1 pyruvate-ferredoxin/flavodoxin oxidoreductase [Breznakia sp. PF5-3]MDF9838790.1 pyruvate-ferredoxin/flavodoxin oxidoreductase [Breznakia sp. PFB2-8]MDF9860822.1 pyruvate-ferredoxin/flavodoxin oxidoreductase [Breznakia sp. PH5-24]